MVERAVSSVPRAPTPLVIRHPTWWQTGWGRLVVAIILLLLGAGLYLVGRAGIGLSGPHPLATAGELRGEIRTRDRQILDLQRQVAELDTLKASQEQERRELARTIGELQAEVATQRQQLEFFRGIVGTANERPDIEIRSLQVVPGIRPGARLLRLSLVQPGTPSAVIAGGVATVIEGRQAGRVARLTGPNLAFRFRYFQNLEGEFVLPADFQPERITLEIKTAKTNSKPLTQTLLWPVEGATTVEVGVDAAEETS
jgi:hypothetical protein